MCMQGTVDSVREISYSDETSGDRALADVFLEFMYV